MRHCQHCGKDMGFNTTARRKFCNDDCRQKWHRAQKAQDSYSDAMTAIYKFAKVPKSEQKKAIESLKLLRTAITDVLRTLGDADTIARADMVYDLNRVTKSTKY